VFETYIRPFIPRLSKHETGKDQVFFFIACLCGLYDELISIITLGYMHTEVRAACLFDWFYQEDHDGWPS